jgi:hypothetical protein
VEINTIDVGRVTVEIVTDQGKKYKALFLGRIILHGNNSIKAIHAKDSVKTFRSKHRKYLKTLCGETLKTEQIEEYNIIKEEAELVTFAYLPKK